MVREIPPEKARQGNSSKKPLIILIGALVAAFVLWGLVELYWFVAMAPEGPTINSNQPPASNELSKLPDTSPETPQAPPDQPNVAPNSPQETPAPLNNGQ